MFRPIMHVKYCISSIWAVGASIFIIIKINIHLFSVSNCFIMVKVEALEPIRETLGARTWRGASISQGSQVIKMVR